VAFGAAVWDKPLPAGMETGDVWGVFGKEVTPGKRIYVQLKDNAGNWTNSSYSFTLESNHDYDIDIEGGYSGNFYFKLYDYGYKVD
jgi:hypothetical protein